jgi:predicted nucleic acid-binding protein
LTLFVDTSMLYAAADAGDRSNARAKEVLSAGEPLITTDHVLAETWLLIRHRLGHDASRRSCW